LSAKSLRCSVGCFASNHDLIAGNHEVLDGPAQIRDRRADRLKDVRQLRAIKPVLIT
jgi:hypothetical protein